MFHLYFGAFDIVLYLGGMYFAMVLANAICDSLDQAEATQKTTAIAPTKAASIQTTEPRLSAPVVKRDEVSVRVSVNG